jgi:outer membrane protein assembly factor BamB
VVWQTAYDHGSEKKPGQLSAGSGTTPTVLPSGLVAITDNADPQMHVQFYDVVDGGLVCEAAVFGQGESASDNSLVAVGDASVVVENNYGYEAPWTTMVGHATPGGLARVDADPTTGECTVGWQSDVVAPTSVAKVSLATGLVYAYTTRPSWWGVSAWYLTAIDARTGETAWSVRTGTGTLYNNHYSAVTLGPDGSAYVATLGGMVRVTDRG